MNGVTIGGKHTFHTFGLLLESKPTISPPEPKTKLVQIPGTDGVIDLSESLTGSIAYQLRTITIQAFLPCRREDWDWKYSQILNHMHGKRMRIIFDEDPEWYYIGRVTVQEMKPEKVCAYITITAEVEPYKHRLQGSGVSL